MGVTVKDIMAIMERHFPPFLAESWDNSGLQLGEAGQTVHRLAVALDLDRRVLADALQQRVDLLITHHPLFFTGIRNIDFSTWRGQIIRDLIMAGITVYSAHTNLDSAENGLNQLLAEKLGLKGIRPLFPARQEELYKIVVYVPVSHVQEVRQAMNDAGAGCIGNYSDCSFRSPGTGTFRPGQHTNPFIGTTGQLEEVEECRLETVACQRDLRNITTAMTSAHPYEEVAYDIYRLENQGRIYCPGRRGELPQPLGLEELARQVKKALGLDSLRVSGELDEMVQKVGVISGSGASFIDQTGGDIDVLITGDIKYHEARDAQWGGLNLIDAGHQGSEEIVVVFLEKLLREELGDRVEITPLYGSACFQSI